MSNHPNAEELIRIEMETRAKKYADRVTKECRLGGTCWEDEYYYFLDMMDYDYIKEVNEL